VTFVGWEAEKLEIHVRLVPSHNVNSVQVTPLFALDVSRDPTWSTTNANHVWTTVECATTATGATSAPTTISSSPTLDCANHAWTTAESALTLENVQAARMGSTSTIKSNASLVMTVAQRAKARTSVFRANKEDPLMDHANVLLTASPALRSAVVNATNVCQASYRTRRRHARELVPKIVKAAPIRTRVMSV